MSFNDHLSSNGLGQAVEVFSTSVGFEHGGMPLRAAFNPAFTVTSKGTMLAFVEGRLDSTHDLAQKTVLVNRSHDMGVTWEGMRALTLPGCHFGPRPYTFVKEGKETIGVLVVYTPYGQEQQSTGNESPWLEQLKIDPTELRPNTACVVVRLTSEDDGETWHQETLTGDKDPFLGFEQKGYWIGVADFTGTVDTIPSGPYVGRKIISMLVMGTEWEKRPDQLPNDHLGMGRLGSALMVSDDGDLWGLGGVIADQRGNEAAATALGKDGRILMLRRPNGFTHDDLKRYDRIIGYRLLHHSDDGGQTWSPPVFPEGLPYLKQDGRRYDHQCLPSLCAWNNTLLTAAPSGVDRETGNVFRTHGVIGFSDDLGVTWRHRLIDDGDFSYATMGRIGDEGVIVMFSRGGAHGAHGSFLRAFTMDWLRQA